MKSVVLTFSDDICLKNNKTATMQSELVTKLGEYGYVEDFDRKVSAIKAEYQKELDKVTAQYNAIVEQKLTVDEMNMVREYRKNKNDALAQKDLEISNLTNTLREVKDKHEQTKQLIIAQLGE